MKSPGVEPLPTRAPDTSELGGRCQLLAQLCKDVLRSLHRGIGPRMDGMKVRMSHPNSRDPEQYRLHAEVCRVLTDPKRLMLLDVLRHGERSVSELAAELGCTLANASQHLGVMRSAGLVETRRLGTTIVYRLAEPDIVEACDVIHRIVDRRRATRTGARRSFEPAVSAGSTPR